MRMIVTIGIMLALLSAVPSLFTSMETVIPVTRSQILKTILQHTNIQHTSKRTEETGEVVSRIECCPAETHFIQLRGGISREGQIVELYRNYRTVQKFYETSCRPDVKDRPCHLVDKRIQNLSRCVQKYSYVYAFVKDYNVSGNYRLDYIRMKTGCSCEVEFHYPSSLAVDAEDD